jgi:hypothetical protein
MKALTAAATALAMSILSVCVAAQTPRAEHVESVEVFLAKHHDREGGAGPIYREAVRRSKLAVAAHKRGKLSRAAALSRDALDLVDAMERRFHDARIDDGFFVGPYVPEDWVPSPSFGRSWALPTSPPYSAP